MPKRRKTFNPFYSLLVVLGVAFVITACAYGLVLLRSNRPMDAVRAGNAQNPLLQLMQRHGQTILFVELGMLLVATVGCITTDDYWERRSAARHMRDKSDVTDEPSPEPIQKE
ncbi:MAG: hypothetical protein IIA67_14135 [Planctomycetes bacterium]|nr:hypothetical protein [Planctomycetota bacterium]